MPEGTKVIEYIVIGLIVIAIIAFWGDGSGSGGGGTRLSGGAA